MQPKVSVIVPVYKVERYLDQCVASLVGQTLRDIQVILVDDGSPDRCGVMVDEWAARDPRILAVHRENGGLGPARNTGIEHATGEYLGFVDSDDWVDQDAYETLYDEAQRSGADIVTGGHCDMTNGVATRVKPHPLAGTVLADPEGIRQARLNIFGQPPNNERLEAFPMSVCMSIYRRSMVIASGVRFRSVLSEDIIFNLPIYAAAHAISFVGITAYRYRKDDQASITKTFSPALLDRYEGFFGQLMELARHEDDGGEAALRAQRTMVDYCRLYTGIVADSDLSGTGKRSELRRLTSCDDFERWCRTYPLGYLPPQQRVFHWALLHGHLRCALWLNDLRMFLKRHGH